jgi:Na+-driven multidrug efflux pump
LVFAPIFIFGFKLGIKGAALATAIATFVSSCYVISHFLNHNSRIYFRTDAFKFDLTIIKNITTIGLSPFLMNATASGIAIIVNSTLRLHGGDLATGAYAIVNSYAMVFTMIVLGLCHGMQPIVGYNFGAGKLKRMKDTLLLTIKVGMGIKTIGLILALLIPMQMARLFTDNTEFTEMAANGLFFVFLLIPLIGFQMVTSNFYQSVNKPALSITMSLSRQLLFFVPCLVFFSNYWGLNGVWYAVTTSDFLSVVVAVSIFVWQKKEFYPSYSQRRKMASAPLSSSTLKKKFQTSQSQIIDALETTEITTA